MKISKLFLGVLVLATSGACTITRSARAHGASYGHSHVTVASLESELSSHGEFVFVAGHGRVWRPYGMRAGWQPYTHGRWVYDDDAWVWASDWSWGWAAFHYGRWTHDTRHGWVWVPGAEWGPAWVAWSYDAGYVGWAPLPPGAYWTNRGWSRSIGPNRWSYVRRADFSDRHIHRVVSRRSSRRGRVHRRYPAPTRVTASRARPARTARARPAPSVGRPAKRAHAPVISRRSAPRRAHAVAKKSSKKKKSKVRAARKVEKKRERSGRKARRR